jgi:hypothetical protein
MKRLHLHIKVSSLPDAVEFYSGLFNASPCCGGTRYANWRIEQPPLNLAASVTHEAGGLAHMGLEVDDSHQLMAADRVLQGPLRPAAAVSWEVSVRKPIVQKECRP